MDKTGADRIEPSLETRIQKSGGEGEFPGPEDLKPGVLINNRYEITQFIGRGGFGMVFAAMDNTLQSEVALKFLHPGLSRSSRDFRRVRREINLSRQITDSRIVKIFSLESWRSFYFLVMERVRGRSLAEYLEESSPLSWEAFAPVFNAILSGVEVLHQHRIIHRDLKPSNIFLVAEGVKILDFGMAKAVDDTEQTAEFGQIVGSPRYMSPEQIRGDKVGAASDIYQLGLILYRALSGNHPFSDCTNTMEMLIKHLETEPPPLDHFRERLPRVFQDVVSRALEKNPRRRFSDVGAMASALRRGKVSSREILRRLGRSVRPWLLVTALAVAMGFVLLRPFTLHRAVIDGGKVTAVSRLGIALWSRDFSPMTVYRTLIVSLRGARSDNWNFVPATSRGAWVVLIPPDNQKVGPESSLGSLDADSRLVLLDGRGRELRGGSFWKNIQLEDHGYSRRFYPKRFDERDLDGDGRNEGIMWVRHSQGMFPSALVVLGRGNSFVYSSPGTIRDYRVTGRDADETWLTIEAMDNPLSHMTYLARVRMPRHPESLHIKAVPNLIINNTIVDTGQQVFLPGGVRESISQADGTHKFIDRDSGASIIWRAGFGMKVTTVDGKTTRYGDDSAVMGRVLSEAKRAYRARILRGDLAAARTAVGAALRLNPSNPFMRSALLYWRGDLRAEAGDYDSARRDLEAALDLYGFNMDAACRLCELELLEGRPEAAAKMARERFGDHFLFWGLSNGGRLFRMWTDLHRGRFHEARAGVDALFFDKADVASAYGGLVDLFAGEYKRAADAFRSLERVPPHLFTLPEFRLFSARALVMAGRDIEKAGFYLRDLETHSPRQGWRVGLLLAYLDTIQGKRSPELVRRAREAWQRIRERSRGDFQARLWLFLDAWCYGRIMETLGDRKAALEGYRACIKANPHSGTAEDAHIRISALSG